ncbi:MAG TPA: hypothetical protein VLA89_17100 [Gemmatimonadales bacterium]|nr:hypothetical protein [Gemmatimonadales bacterium]
MAPLVLTGGLLVVAGSRHLRIKILQPSSAHSKGCLSSPYSTSRDEKQMNRLVRTLLSALLLGASLAAVEMPAAVGTTPDGTYGPKTKAAMYWPKYKDGRAYGCDPGSVLNDAG